MDEENIEDQAYTPYYLPQEAITSTIKRLEATNKTSFEVSDELQGPANELLEKLLDLNFADNYRAAFEFVKDDLRVLNSFNDPKRGFSEKEAQILHHQMLKKLIDKGWSPILESAGRLGIVHGESLKFKDEDGKIGTYFSDAVVNMWKTKKQYFPILLLEVKPDLNEENCRIGKQEMIKYLYMISKLGVGQRRM